MAFTFTFSVGYEPDTQLGFVSIETISGGAGPYQAALTLRPFDVGDAHYYPLPTPTTLPYRIGDLGAGDYQIDLFRTTSNGTAEYAGLPGYASIAGGDTTALPAVLHAQGFAPTAAGGTGSLSFEAKAAGNLDVVLISTEPAGAGFSPVTISRPTLAPGFFSFPGLYPHDYRVTVYGFKEGTYAEVTVAVPQHVPPSVHVGDQFSFLPWVKSKLSRAAGPVADRPRPGLDLQLTTEVSDAGGAPVADVTTTALELYGPGDVVGLSPAAVLRTTPAADEQNFPPLHLASIEFQEEDLPWRYSLDAATATNQVRPWCFLLALEAAEFSAVAPGSAPLPGIVVAAGVPLPDPDQLWLWAHVQVNQVLGTSEAEVNAFLEGPLRQDPALAFSRLFSARRLKPGTRYQAFLLPTYEAGRRAGLGEDPAGAGEATRPAWPASSTGLAAARAFPVYHQWSFQTGAGSDFESLARLLQPATVTGNAGGRQLEVNLPLTAAGGGAGRYTLPLPGVLEPLGTVAAPLPLSLAQDIYAALRPGLVPGRVGSGGRPVVAPPLYGRAYLPPPPAASSDSPGVGPLLAEPGPDAPDDWLGQVNLDPRYRVVAGLGSQLVQEQQEEYVRRAWDQVQDLLVANLNLRSLQVGLEASAALRRQHLPLEVASPPGTGRPAPAPTTAPSAGPGSPAAPAGALAPAEGAAVPEPMAAAVAPPFLANYGLQLTGLALSRVRLAATGLSARETIRRSNVPLAAFSPTFRRLLRPLGPYQVNLVGRPRRPTQAPDPAPAGEAGSDPLGPGTGLRQRDELLTELQTGRLRAAPPKASLFRAYQFDDSALNGLLADGRAAPAELRVLDEQGYRAISDADALADFGTAFAALRTQTRFRTLDPPQPPLDVAALKSGVAAGTDPARVLPARARRALTSVPKFVTGDFEAADFAAADFLVDAPVRGVSVRPPSEPQAVASLNAAALAASDAPAEQVVLLPTNEQLASSGRLLATATAEASTPTATAGNEPPIKPLTMAPVFQDALGEELRRRHPGLLLAGLESFPANRVALMQINRAFVEAYLLGANHALGSELLWRDFPVDLRASFFRQFWDVRDFLHTQPVATATPAALAAREDRLRDVAPLHTWAAATALGQHPGAGPAAQVVLVARAELLQRFPNTVVCAQRAIPGSPGGGLVPDPDPFRTRYPVHRLPIGQDLVALAFDLTPAEALGTDPPSEGYFFVFMERPGEPQFGLDEGEAKGGEDTTPPPPLNLPSWNDLSWPYLNVNPGENLVIDPAGRPQVSADPVPHVRNSAELAYALFQQPVMVAIPARQLVQGIGG